MYILEYTLTQVKGEHFGKKYHEKVYIKTPTLIFVRNCGSHKRNPTGRMSMKCSDLIKWIISTWVNNTIDSRTDDVLVALSQYEAKHSVVNSVHFDSQIPASC